MPSGDVLVFQKVSENSRVLPWRIRHGHHTEKRAHFKTDLNLFHNSRHIWQISRTGNAKALYDGVVKRIIENRVHRLLIRWGQAKETVFLVASWTRAVPYEPDITAEYFSNAEHTCAFAEWGPKGRLHVSMGVIRLTWKTLIGFYLTLRLAMKISLRQIDHTNRTDVPSIRRPSMPYSWTRLLIHEP